MRYEEEPNLTLFFRPFLNTPEEMAAHLGFSMNSLKRIGFGRRKPQIAVHAGVWCQVHYEKVSEKEPQILLLSAVNETTSLAVRP
jgi:hypothetical protein